MGTPGSETRGVSGGTDLLSAGSGETVEGSLLATVSSLQHSSLEGEDSKDSCHQGVTNDPVQVGCDSTKVSTIAHDASGCIERIGGTEGRSRRSGADLRSPLDPSRLHRRWSGGVSRCKRRGSSWPKRQHP